MDDDEVVSVDEDEEDVELDEVAWVLDELVDEIELTDEIEEVLVDDEEGDEVELEALEVVVVVEVELVAVTK